MKRLLGDDARLETEPADGSTAHPHRTIVRQLVAVSGPDDGTLPKAVTMDRCPVVIGRQPSSDGVGCELVALEDSQASRSHVELHFEETTRMVRLRDLGSRNGTFVDGIRTLEGALPHGSVLRVGRTVFVYSETSVATAEKFARETPLLLGRSLSMQRVRAEIADVARSMVSVLLLGESGSGKERAAGEIHRTSGRPGPLVPVNCAAIPEGLAESMFFGHSAGAFTGATQKSDGFFAMAEGGTLFLDEVGEMPLPLQAKLLRVLASGELQTVGARGPMARKVDVRIVAATNVDLEAAALRNSFRGDLFARLAGWVIRLPPLRDRREDVLGLARLVLDDEGITLSSGAAEALVLHSWPYNVRELEQVVRAACLRAGRGKTIRPEHLPATLADRLGRSNAPEPAARSELPLAILVPPDVIPNEAQLRLLAQRLQGNVGEMARYFGKDRKQVYRWLERHAIDPDAARPGD